MLVTFPLFVPMVCRNICLRLYTATQVSGSHYLGGGKYCRRCEYYFITQKTVLLFSYFVMSVICLFNVNVSSFSRYGLIRLQTLSKSSMNSSSEDTLTPPPSQNGVPCLKELKCYIPSIFWFCMVKYSEILREDTHYVLLNSKIF